jgi:octopine/nopaline transport system ATP-binding protein
MRRSAIPLTYLECRERFRIAARRAGATLSTWPIPGEGPSGESLAIDVARLGAERPRRALLAMSGTHGVEGFAGSAVQTDFLSRCADDAIANDAGVVLVHAVNPWGMAWWRRANESNVDLNRNWGRGPDTPSANDAYEILHPLVVPDGETLPDPELLMRSLAELAAEHGHQWVAGGITSGQSSHPDGLYHCGVRPEASTLQLAEIIRAHISGADDVTAVDLHTGHGRFGTATILSCAAEDSTDDRWLHDTFGSVASIVRTGVGDTASLTRRGALLDGVGSLLPTARYRWFTHELGTVGEGRMIRAEVAEHWVHRFGDANNPEHTAARWEHRWCSCPDDPAWEDGAIEHGRALFDALLHELR